ncbi:MAG: hypothetical protein V3V17_07005 [Alphaproteobacteria bacterium]|nr:hypothetical protein [Pseudomonadota bacterium]
MAQAHRVRKSRRRKATPAAESSAATANIVGLSGTYTMEQKITVEWDLEMPSSEFKRLLARILTEPRSFREIHSYVSGRLKERDRYLPSGKISNYRVSPRSLRKALVNLESVGFVQRRREAAQPRSDLWLLTATSGSWI